MPATVAIVEDHRLLRQALTNLVRQSTEFEVLYVAENGRDLLDQMLSVGKIPDLALVDLHMPVLDGFETTTRLRQLYPAIRVLIVTISDLKEELIDAIRSGAHGYLIKGQSDELLQAMHEVMTNDYYFPITLTSSNGNERRN